MLAFGGSLAIAALPAMAQSQTDQAPQRVEITGSAIKRVDAETAVPVTVLKVDDLKAQGLTTVEQIVSTLTANQSSQATAQAVGLSTGGVSLVDLRGLGANKTLVLLNGRRIANSSFDGSAPDLNMIPMATLERVEVLRDGASALYGTDAVGGVINFITRKDYQGGTFSLGYDQPEHGGGTQYSANAGFGFGSLDDQGFNVFGFVDYQKQDHISGTDRDYNTRFPGGISKSTSPANFYQDPKTVGNPDAPDCATGVFLIPSGTSCSMTTSKFVDYIPASQRTSGFLKGELKLGANNLLSAEYFVTRNEVKTLIAPVPYGFFMQNPTKPDGSPNPYYPGNSGAPFTPNVPLSNSYDGTALGFGGPLLGSNSICTDAAGNPYDCTLADLGLTSKAGSALKPGFVVGNWRDVPNGPRGDDNISLQQRFVLSLEGSAGSWDYRAGLALNHTKTDENLISGYGSGDMIYEGILDGIINPYGAQDAAGSAYLDQALLKGDVMTGVGKTSGADFQVSNSQLGDWLSAGRQAAVAVGAEYRHEDYKQYANTDYATQVYASTGIDPTTYNAGTRNVYAVYTELDVPLHKTVDLTLAARYDHYSDFGSTTNPKVSLRWQPSNEVVVRGAYSTGFRAPGLYELHASNSYTNTGNIADPVTCPGGKGSGSDGAPDYCNDQFVALAGGNTNLKPEKSHSYTLGVVVEPSSNFSGSADYWHIKMTDLIGFLDETVLLDPANAAGWASQYIHRNGNGVLSDVTQVCPGPACGYLDEREQNLGGVVTSGIDFNGTFRQRSSVGLFTVNYNSTWVQKYESQQYQNGPWLDSIGHYNSLPTFRWNHNLTIAWKNGAYNAGITGHYKTGTLDVDNKSVIPAFSTADVYVGYEPIKRLDLVFGIRNLTDEEPPLSHQTTTFQAGYDPRFYDPTGRTFYLRGTYSF
jgi:iron complex outermembrane receptor protein